MIRKTAQRIFISLVLLSVGLVFPFNGMASATGALSHLSVSLSPSANPSSSSNYSIAFTTASAASLDEVDMQFATTPSGSLTVPTGLGIGSTTLGSTTGLGAGTWTYANSSGLAKITATAVEVGAATAVTIVLNTITNPSLNACGASVNGSSPAAQTNDTCFIRITTMTGSSVPVDVSNVSFTLIPAITASAEVDPSLTFNVTGVVASTTDNNNVVTTQTSTYAALPFGHENPGQTSVVEQQLAVISNAAYGYTVDMAMTSAMKDPSAADQIYPFNPTAGGNMTTLWSTAIAWSAPTGTPGSSSSSWLGANTDSTNVGGNWSSLTTAGTPLWGPVSTTYVPVSLSTTPDNGTQYTVGYEFETDAYQPAQTYTGTLNYTVVATY